MERLNIEDVPPAADGPSIVAAASALMLLPENASKLVRLHRLAALGLALPDKGVQSLSPSSIRAMLKRDDVGGAGIRAQEDPYSEVLIQSVNFYGGPYRVSPGAGEHTVADLENLLDAVFRHEWMQRELRVPIRQLVQGLLTVSDLVLTKAGLRRGTPPAGLARTPIFVPGAAKMKVLIDATFISVEELDAHGEWLRMVVDTFATDPGLLHDPCGLDVTDDRLYVTPFLRVPGGYRLVVPLDLLITARFHLMRLTRRAGQLEELGRRLQTAAFHRIMRLFPRDTKPVLVERGDLMTRYIVQIDTKRDVHLIFATDTLKDWEEEVWGIQETGDALNQLATLISASCRMKYSSAEELLHLLIVDSPGRAGFWGVPNVDGADPVLIARSDDIEVMMHGEPDGLLGLLLFGQAVQRRPGESISMDILDEFSSYTASNKSFYLSDETPPDFTMFQVGDGFHARQKFALETDRHGVIPPRAKSPIVSAVRRYEGDAPEIFTIESGTSYVGYVVEIGERSVFITVDLEGLEVVGVESNLLECVAFWVRECANQVGGPYRFDTTELVLKVADHESWKKISESSTRQAAVQVEPSEFGFSITFTGTFVSLLRGKSNVAERELVEALLTSVFGLMTVETTKFLALVAPLGSKRMLRAFDQSQSPDMLAEGLPQPYTGHDQVGAQLLDELGAWLRSPSGAGLEVGALNGSDRVRVLNDVVAYLFDRLEREVERFNGDSLLDFLISQNESLIHDARISATMLKSRLACFGENSSAATELVQKRRDTANAHRANRFLIEYVAARPPTGTRAIDVGDYLRLLAISSETIERATASDFLHYELADFEVSILKSGRLGVSRDEPFTLAMETYADLSGQRSVREARIPGVLEAADDFDATSFILSSEGAMRAEFGFTLTELREVCGGLLDLGMADKVTRISRAGALEAIAKERALAVEIVDAVLEGITLTARASFLSIGQDAWPWRFNRDMSYLRRPLVLQRDSLVFGFRSIHRLGPYWIENLLSGRLQGRAKTLEMQRCITEARSQINASFARSVAARLVSLGVVSKHSVNKIGRKRIVDKRGSDLGDVDILGVHARTRSIVAIEAKDFEIARTPGEIANELEKLFLGSRGKKATVELHGRRIEWLQENLDEVLKSFGIVRGRKSWRVVGAIVTSDPLLSPIVAASSLPVIAFADLDRDLLGLNPHNRKGSSKRKKRR